MRYSLKIILIWILMLVMVLSSSLLSFAEQSFTDVADDYWAYSFIEKVNKIDAMPGFEDATFRPTAEVTRLEAIVSIYRVLKASGKIDDVNEDSLAIKYYGMINEAKIPTELEPYGKTYPALSYALENQIIEQAELKAFISDDKLIPAKKVELIVFIAKALNVFKNVDLKYSDKIISFDFVDDADINSLATNYVYFLIENNVISGKGNEDGKLLPKVIVTRQLLAAMLCGFNDSLISPGSVPVESKYEPVNSSESSEGVTTGTYVGSIENFYPLENLVEIRDGNRKNNIYDVEGAKVLMGSKEMSSKNLQQGQEVSVTLMDGKIVQINILKDYDRYEGKYLKLSAVSTDSTGEYRVLTMAKEDGGYGFFKIRDDIEVESEGQEASISDLNENDKIILIAETDGYDGKRITLVPKLSEESGILYADSEFNVGDIISIKTEDGRIVEHKIETSTNIISRSGEKIKRGEIVNITSEFGEMVKLEGTGMKSEDTGTIKEIIISATPKITIERIDGTLKTYGMQENADMIFDDSSENHDVYDLRLGQNIKVDLSNSGISKLTIVEKVEAVQEELVKINGKIIEIFKSINNFKLEDSTGKIWTVGIKSGSDINILEYKVDDSVYIFGNKLSNEFIEAERIIK